MTNTEISNADKIMLGNTEASAMYIGNIQIWGNQLPYDAKIEYLESTGTQYININGDTKYLVNIPGIQCNITIKRVGDVGQERAYVGKTDGGGFDLQMDSSRGISLWKNKYLSAGSSTFDKDKHNISFQITDSNLYLIVDGTEYSTTNSGNSYQGYVQLFAHSNNYFALGRIYQCEIYNNNIKIADLIPVRVGQVGYMYDKISNQLFGNNGTGSFVLGPDL